MESLYLIIPAALILFGIAVAMFFWSVDDGQYEDLEGEGSRILYDEDQDAMSEAGPLTTHVEASDDLAEPKPHDRDELNSDGRVDRDQETRP